MLYKVPWIKIMQVLAKRYTIQVQHLLHNTPATWVIKLLSIERIKYLLDKIQQC